MERAIHLGGTLLAFLTMIILTLVRFFSSARSPRLRQQTLPNYVVSGFCTLAVLDKGLEICGIGIETLRNQHCLVSYQLLVGEIVDQLRFIKHLRVLEERWQLSHP